MAVQSSIRTDSPEVPPECIHCYGSGQIYEATEDASYECYMCLGTGRKMDRSERERIKAERERVAAEERLTPLSRWEKSLFER